MTKTARSLLLSAALAAFCPAAFQGQEPARDFPVLRGPYLGQKPPGPVPEVFAPGVINTGMFVRDVAMTPDGREFYFGLAAGGYAWSTICVTRLVDGRWTPPEVMPHMEDPRFLNFEPCISPDGSKFYFLSTRPDAAAGDKERGDQDIWVMDRAGDGWGIPYNLGGPVNTAGEEYFPSVTRDGTLYFTRTESDGRTSAIYRSRFMEGRFLEPEKLPPQVNCGTTRYNAFIAPDESYIIVPAAGRKDSLGGTDYYVVFRGADDSWSEPVHLGPAVNSPAGQEFSPYVSPDGKYFFFMSNRFLPREHWPAKLTYAALREAAGRAPNGQSAIYWMDAGFIETLRPKTSPPAVATAQSSLSDSGRAASVLPGRLRQPEI